MSANSFTRITFVGLTCPPTRARRERESRCEDQLVFVFSQGGQDWRLVACLAALIGPTLVFARWIDNFGVKRDLILCDFNESKDFRAAATTADNNEDSSRRRLSAGACPAMG